ncbi:hypothetical protein D3C72_1725370 [compost metagenome]
MSIVCRPFKPLQGKIFIFFYPITHKITVGQFILCFSMIGFSGLHKPFYTVAKIHRYAISFQQLNRNKVTGIHITLLCYFHKIPIGSCFIDLGTYSKIIATG